jgi:hypothetical protein
MTSGILAADGFRALGCIAALLVGACSSLAVPMNEPLRSAAGNTEYRLLDVNRLGGAESALVLVALSGGGKRSAAFGHGGAARHAGYSRAIGWEGQHIAE